MNDLTTGFTENIVPETADVPVENVPLEHLEKTAEKKSKTDKRLEKLNALKDKYGKAVLAQETAEKKTQDISAQIEEIENELHAEEAAELDKACAVKNLSYREIANFLMKIPDDMTLTDIRILNTI